MHHPVFIPSTSFIIFHHHHTIHHFLTLPFQTWNSSVPQILPTTDPLLLTGLQPDCLHGLRTTQRYVLVFSSSSFSWRMYFFDHTEIKSLIHKQPVGDLVGCGDDVGVAFGEVRRAGSTGGLMLSTVGAVLAAGWASVCWLPPCGKFRTHCDGACIIIAAFQIPTSQSRRLRPHGGSISHPQRTPSDTLGTKI